MPINELWTETLRHLEEGNFTALEAHLGGPDEFDRRIIEWHAEGKFDKEPEALAEALSCACMLGRAETVKHLLDAGVDPYAGMRTGLAGPHWAASGGHPEIIRLLIGPKVSFEVKNIYGGTVLGQAVWSAVNEFRPGHADLIEMLIDAGSVIEDGTLAWWNSQDVPDESTRNRVATALERAGAV